MRPIVKQGPTWLIRYRPGRSGLRWDCGVRTHRHRFVWAANLCDAARACVRWLLNHMEGR